jgi:hypothetical protein
MAFEVSLTRGALNRLETGSSVSSKSSVSYSARTAASAAPFFSRLESSVTMRCLSTSVANYWECSTSRQQCLPPQVHHFCGGPQLDSPFSSSSSRISLGKKKASKCLLEWEAKNTARTGATSLSCQRKLARAAREETHGTSCAIMAAAAGTLAPPVREDSYADEQDFIKAGGEELDLVQLQASKTMEQPKIAEKVCMYVLGSSSPS